jgi:hypothetical protein
MSARLAAASAVAASFLALVQPAVSADLYAPPHGGAGYDDRYGDAYGDAYGEVPRDYRRYGESENYDPPYRPRTSFRGGYGYEPPYEARYDARVRVTRFEDDCVPHQIVRERLRADGWDEFQNVEPRGRVVLLQARRPSGRVFDLTVEKCSGEVVDARPLSGARFFAHGERRFWQRPY